jgi:hypothetical protein
MEKDQIKKFIAEQVAAGLSLSKILDLLKEKGAAMTFMELRLLASELESVDWSKTDKPEAKEIAPAKPAPAQESALEETEVFDGSDEALQDEPLPGEEAEAGDAPAKDGAEKPADGGLRGKTTVEVSKLVKPGCVASGSVQFGSGAKADWFLDQYGRLGLDKAVGKPDKQDVAEFQAELQKEFAKMGY